MLFFLCLINQFVFKHSFAHKQVRPHNFFCNSLLVQRISNKTEFPSASFRTHNLLRSYNVAGRCRYVLPFLKFSPKRPHRNAKACRFLRIEFTRTVKFFKSIAYARLCMLKRKCADVKIFALMNDARRGDFLYDNRIVYVHIKNLAA